MPTFHAQGDHVFNDWRPAFATLGDGVQGLTQNKAIAQKAVEVFAPLADDPVVTGLRHLTATCPGHPGDADQNSLDFGAAKQDFTVALVHRVVSAYYGAAGPDLAFLANRTLQALFARLTKASYDPDAAKALVDGANGPRKLALDVQIKAGKAHYDVVAPKTLSDILSGLAFA